MPPPKKESDIQAALKDIRTTLQRTKALAAAAANTSNVTSPTIGYSNGNINNMSMSASSNSYYDRTSTIVERKESPTNSLSPVWIPRYTFEIIFENKTKHVSFIDHVLGKRICTLL